MREEKEESKEDILKHLNVWFVLGGSQPRLHFVSRLKRWSCGHKLHASQDT